VDVQLEPCRCIECGRELLDVEPGVSEPSRCEDCRPETGPGSLFADRLSINLRQLRLNAGLSPPELAEAAGLHESTISGLEGDGGHDLRLVTALRLVGPLGVSIDQLVERIFWNPGQVTRGSKRPPSERLTGFFLVVPGNVPVFEPAPPQEPVTTRQEAAAILGANVRDARERRHLTQRALGASSGVSKAGLSLIERGVRETSIETLCGLARSLEMPPKVLLQGIAWRPEPTQRQRSRARCPGRSRDDAIRRLWNEDKTAREIAQALGTSSGTVSATVHRLRERGEPLRYRRTPTRAVHERARGRRVACQSSSPAGQAADAVPTKPAHLAKASNEEVAKRIGENVAKRRAETGLSLRELEEATETHFSHLARIERGRTAVPQLALILKLAGSLNVRCSLLTAGVVWDAGSGAFQVLATPPEPQTALGCLGENARRARYGLDLSQQALSDVALMSRGDLVDFERGSRNFRIFTIVRLAGALGVSFAELFAGVANWHVRPLAPPEFLPGEEPTKFERDQLLARLWREGCPEREIAEALDLSGSSVGPCVRDLRDAGQALSYRRSPRGPAEIAARRRRDRLHAGRCTEPGRPSSGRGDDPCAPSPRIPGDLDDHRRDAEADQRVRER
jgi:transcriptional regulator with XRE-family HTH domain